MHSHICPFADILVVRAFVGILKASPAADIINKDHAIVGLPVFNIIQQFPQASSPGKAQAALPGIATDQAIFLAYAWEKQMDGAEPAQDSIILKIGIISATPRPKGSLKRINFWSVPKRNNYHFGTARDIHISSIIKSRRQRLSQGHK
jgi:hypothetical protein